MSDDAVKVHCDMEQGGETCVFPDVHASKDAKHSMEKSGNGWYSSLRGGFKITYDSVGPVQMSFLRLLSAAAHQNITYTCINSAAWYDIHSRSYKNSIKFLGDNDDIFSSTSTNKPIVEIDGCKMRKGESKTVFSLRTEKRSQLPVIDFFPRDYGLPHQAFGFEIGPVCFR